MAVSVSWGCTHDRCRAQACGQLPVSRPEVQWAGARPTSQAYLADAVNAHGRRCLLVIYLIHHLGRLAGMDRDGRESGVAR